MEANRRNQIGCFTQTFPFRRKKKKKKKEKEIKLKPFFLLFQKRSSLCSHVGIILRWYEAEKKSWPAKFFYFIFQFSYKKKNLSHI